MSDTINPYLAEVADSLDAIIFTGDSLTHQHNRKALREYLERWQRELDNMEADNED